MNTQQFITYAKRNGIELEPCTHFDGPLSHKGKEYFNVLTNERHWCSQKLEKLYRLAKQYGKFTVEPNGIDRLAIFTR